jgi:uncharacterized protein with HEPN domain
MARTARERLGDIVESISRIERFLAGKSVADFCSDALIHDAVVRNLEIVSEASRHIPEALKAMTAETPWRDIANFGNWLRHAYEGLDDEVLWNTIERDLPALLAVVRNLLARPDVK